MSDVQEIIENYGLGNLTAVEKISSGLMHQTHRIKATSGVYFLQCLHPKLSSQEILDDYVRVTQHLQRKGFESPRVIATRDGRFLVCDQSDRMWRLTSAVRGETFEKVTSCEQALEGACMLGRFHVGMADFPHDFESNHPLHDTDGHLEKLTRVLSEESSTDDSFGVHKASVEIFSLIEQVRLPEDLPIRVVHGDPKISNIMFEDSKSVGMIDLDTCNRHSVLVDLGDAIRSWCRDGYEDEYQNFHLDRFDAIIKGYIRSGFRLTREEVRNIWRSGPLITLELASRFARDVIEDEYFAFDEGKYESRKAHNVARMNSMLHLARDMMRKRTSMESIVESNFADLGEME